MNAATLSQQVINAVINTLSAVLPHLDEFTKTEWLVYQTGTWTGLSILLAQGAIFLALLAGASLFDLYRKNI
jgi:hypothetical protein